MEVEMIFLRALIIASIIIAAGIAAFAYSGVYDVGASSPHNGLSNWFMSTTSRSSIRRKASNIDVPYLDDDGLVLAGVNDFDAMCVGCHGAPGQSPAAVGQGLNPPAPDLSESAGEMSAAELFWVTKHGIKMTGMPSWGATHDDDALWPVVAFMVRLPKIDAGSYQQLKVDAQGAGHHDAEDAGPHDQEEPATTTGGENDHNMHSHGDPPAVPAAEPVEDGHEDHEH
jgi:hypothetical protein